MMQTATEVAAEVRAGRQSAREVTQRALSRIAAAEPGVNAFRRVRIEAALAEADAVDRRSERFSLPLAGVPVAVKDNVPVAGEAMRVGSSGSDPHPVSRTHDVVRRLRRAGAVVVGLTNVPELCVYGTTDSDFGITRNPWNPSRTPGGSSGGSAAAVSAGLVPIAHGNDGLGSIRIPAACCGLVGIKPGEGVVPSELGNGSWFGMAENGPLATTVADCALLLSVFADRPELAHIAEPPPPRGAVSTRPPLPATPVDRHWVQATHETAAALGELGHHVREADPRYGAGLGPALTARWFAGVELDAQLLTSREAMSRRTRRQAALGRAVTRLGLPRDASRQRWRQRAADFFADVDVLLTPTLAQPAPAAQRWAARGLTANLLSNTRYAPFAGPWNLAGWPAIAVPAGLDPSGLPLSVQLVAPPGNEARLLAVAAQLESVRPWQRLAPGAVTDAPQPA